AEQSRQANVTAVEDDARTAGLIGKALDEAGDDLIELRRFEAAEGTANQLSKSRNIKKIFENLPSPASSKALPIKPAVRASSSTAVTFA
ncbi:unnamed protein product, partial [Rotaria sordida]